jgi:hypothetical protein
MHVCCVLPQVCTGSAGSDVLAALWQQQLGVRGVLFMSCVTSLVPNFREIEVRQGLGFKQY